MGLRGASKDLPQAHEEGHTEGDRYSANATLIISRNKFS